jgi:hypothetical protein
MEVKLDGNRRIIPGFAFNCLLGNLLFLFMKLRVLVIAFLLLAPLTPSISATLPKAGAICSKAGVTNNYNGKKYTCVKSGKKLVWDKGVLVIKPTPVISPTPIPMTSSSPTPIIIPTQAPTPSPTTSEAAPSRVGDICDVQGDSKTSGNTKLICRVVAGGVNKYFDATNTFATASNPKSPDSLSICRLTDQRPKPVQPDGSQITYPVIPRIGSVKTGVEKIAIVGFDFNDSPGQGGPLDIFGNTMNKAADFFNWYSNGKVKFEFATYDKWIRLSKPSSFYVTGPHFTSIQGALTVHQMAEEFKSSIGRYINLNGYTAIWFVYPMNIQTIEENFGLASYPSIYGIGPSSYQIELPLWTYYVHEMLHEQGLQGHSPKEPWRFGVLLNGNGYTAGMNSWDELSVDWMTEDDIYCIDKSHLNPVQIELAPIERQQSGIHSIMIKLDDHRALVIESHRQGDFAPGMPDYGYGVTLQLVDTTKSTTWDDDKATSVYLKISNSQRNGPEYGTRINNKQADDSGINEFNGVGVSGARWGLDQNFLMLEGEKYTFEGITINFVRSGNTDLISLTK